MSDDTKEVLKTFQDLLKLPSGKKAIYDRIVGNEPADKEIYISRDAKQLLPIINAMIEDKEDREFRFEDFSSYWKPNTVWIKINQCVKFIVENLDTPEKKYSRWREQIQIKRNTNGVLLEWIKNPLLLNRGWIAHKVKTTEEEKIIAGYREKIFKFLAESKPNEYIHLKELTLDEEEVSSLKKVLSDNKEFLFKISETEIKIIHIGNDETSN